MARVASQAEKDAIRSGERCYQSLRRLLVRGQIAPGTRLREVEWSEKLKVQRAALREAMVLLVHDGLLLRRDRGGFFTPSVAEIDVDSVIDARVILETGGVHLTCNRKLPPDAFQPVADMIDVMQQCHEAEMFSGFAEADLRFHQRLIELSANSQLIKMFSHSAQLIYIDLTLLDESHHESEVTTIREHQQILSLVREGKADEASALLKRHLNTVKVSTKAHLS